MRRLESLRVGITRQLKNRIEFEEALKRAEDAYTNNPVLEISMLAEDLKDIAEDNLKDSISAIDRASQVEILDKQYTRFTIHVKRPPVEPKSYKIKQKELIPGRYFEIHGPGGRVRVTRNADVMMKAKRQGVHIQTKYQLPDGKTPVTRGIYDDQDAERITPLPKKEVIDVTSQEFLSAISRFGNRIKLYLERFRGSSG